MVSLDKQQDICFFIKRAVIMSKLKDAFTHSYLTKCVAHGQSRSTVAVTIPVESLSGIRIKYPSEPNHSVRFGYFST